MTKIFTDKQIVDALLALSKPKILSKKSLLRNRRAKFLEKARDVRMKNLRKFKNRSNAMKAVWAKRKAQ
jgi:riboflavin biosynthesis pyrimidine reductase